MAVVRDIDLGWSRIREELRRANGSFTKVGVQAGETRDDDGVRTDLVTVAAANEFGTARIPARSFLRSTFDEKRDQLGRVIEGQYEKILAGKSTVAQSLFAIGELHQAQVQAKIRSNVPPPNAPSTVRRKARKAAGGRKLIRQLKTAQSAEQAAGAIAGLHGYSRTLIDTGQLIGGIRHVEVIAP